MPIGNTLEIVKTENKRVVCDGGGGALGHPMVYLQMGEASEIICPYCSRQFQLEKNLNTDNEH